MQLKNRILDKRLWLIGGVGLLCGFLCLATRPPSRADEALPEPQKLAPQATPTAIPQPFPTTPPDASKITVSAPDVDGYATVIGAPSAVEPLAAVAVINLSAQTPMTTTADANGAFTTTLYAPPGSSLQIRYDPAGDRVNQFWQEALVYEADRAVQYMNPLPGTTLHVGAPPPGDGSRQEFHRVGQITSPAAGGGWGWAGRWLSGTIQVPPGNTPPGLHVDQGDTVTVTMHVHVTSPVLNCTGTPTYTLGAGLQLRYLFDSDGRALPWGIWFNAHLFTPTGLPIEEEGPGETLLVSQDNLFPSLSCVSGNSSEGSLTITFTVPSNLPDGIYLPEVILYSDDVPTDPDMPYVRIWNYDSEAADLPPLAVGSVAPPRIPWTLLVDYPINGHRGVPAREDERTFALPTRVLYPPHQVMIPRLDERTGESLVYRLEPGSGWLSLTDRRLANPPRIPLAFPSGEITVEVFKPGGGTDQLGPTVIQQSSVRSPTIPDGNELNEGTGNIGDLFHLHTMDDAFAYSFEEYGPHTIHVQGNVQDIYGNAYSLDSTYDLIVARVLDLDPAQLPTTPYVQGDAFAPGLHIFPPVPADVRIELTHMPYSDPAQIITATIAGQANRFGYFQPPADIDVPMDLPGEFRVDYSAFYEAPDGTLWAGAMTWGNVVEGPAAQIEAHGRRGMDYKSDTIDDMPAWFILPEQPPEKIGIEVYYPYFSGDIHWGGMRDGYDGDPGDSIHSVITVRDLTPGQTLYDLLRAHFPRSYNAFRWPPLDGSLAGLEKRLDIDEAPLFSTTSSGLGPGVAPHDIDLWGYWYGSSERPDVHVREIVSEDGMGTAYWRFDDTYGYQIGEPADGDQSGDLKWEFGGAVLRVISETNPINEYAVYSSLWVLLPGDDDLGARVTPPFRGAGALNGGPIMTITVQGVETPIDVLFLPKGVRPGDVLEVGDVVAFSGHVGPPLDSRVSLTITSPSNTVYTRTWHANKIGWLYDSTFDFVADEAGRWTVDVMVVHDRPYQPTGLTPTEYNRGTVLGTTGRYEFYVVEPDSPRLYVSSPEPGFIVWPQGAIEPIHIQGQAPPGTSIVHYTIHDKGTVMRQETVVPEPNGAFTVTYDALALNADFPYVSLIAHEGRWEGLADEVSINLLAVGEGKPRANTVTLIGEEVFVWSGEPPSPSYGIYLPVVLKN